jgi:LssY-like putative type I secretion system component LssY
MPKNPILVAATAVVLIATAAAQSPQAVKDVTVEVSATQPWTDTGLELQAGDSITISASALPAKQGVPCSPTGTSTGAPKGELPLPSAPAGALIARLHAQGATPVMVGAKSELHIEDASHLFLGMNWTGNPTCEGGFSVTIQTSRPSSEAGAQQKTRGEQLKSQLSNAAQVFLEGQFGIGKKESTSSAAAAGTSTSSPSTSPSLNVSKDTLDPDLRKNLDSLPRRVNDQLQNLGDMVNFVIIGSQKDVQAALEAATWQIADTGNTNAAVNAVLQTYENKDYLKMPMSTLYLFGRKQDFGYEMAEPIAMVASRHHFRIWKAPFTWKGQEIWVGAGTHDIGFAKDKRNNSVTHKIDPAVDGERDNIGSSLQQAHKAKSMTYYLPPNPVQEAKNATGDTYHSDGRLLVVFLQ